MIEVRVRKKLGEFQLDAELFDKGFICLAGQNGSGKTTLLKIISGIMAPDEGFVKLDSRDITSLPLEKRGVVLVAPDSYIPHLQVEKHLVWGARTRGVQVDHATVTKVKNALGISYETRLSRLSLGMRERVALATALLSQPRVVLIDETFSNIDNRDQFITEFRNLSSEASADVIFTTQFPEDSKLAEHKYVMEAGKAKRIS
jgi:molybdate/tungstate transport system ATP-binding protein